MTPLKDRILIALLSLIIWGCHPEVDAQEAIAEAYNRWDSAVSYRHAIDIIVDAPEPQDPAHLGFYDGEAIYVFPGRASSTEHLVGTILHELGHAHGLDHSSNPQSIMGSPRWPSAYLDAETIILLEEMPHE